MKNTLKIGIVAASATLALLSAIGFQAKTEKYGVVDIAKVFNDSDYTKKQNDVLRAVGESRTGILDFMENFRVFTAEQATRFRELSLKADRTPAEQAELDKIKTAVQDSDAAFKKLQTKANPTPEEVTQLQDFNSRSQASATLSQRWAREFDDEVRTLNEKLRADTMGRIKIALKDVGSKQGYTLLFSEDVAPYGANDMTADAVKAMNAQK